MPRALLVRATVPGLLRLAAVEWAWMGACWLAMALWPPVAPLAVLVLGARIHALGVIFHDAVHLSARHKGPGLRLLEVLTGYPVASTWESTRYHHLRHHHDAGLPTDPYRRRPHRGWRLGVTWLLFMGVLPFWMLRGPVGLLAWGVPALRGAYARVFLQAGAVKAPPDAEEVLACARSEAGQVLFHLGVLALAWHWPAAVGWGYGLPLGVAAALNAHRLLAEHTPVEARGRTMEDVLAVTSDHGLGWRGRLGLAPRNVGYHVVHHLHPQVALEHLPRLREWYVAHFPHHYPPPR
ncbi:fatty acid desaturase family protein [Pyxidicoccus xibeiensis]|uniref:fatty acid desaturase family protein n=1 Tax=Pyxidicoccus xibeiensis TaxID=2906759 RepID=UPI0020A70BA5|nr:fatty acid desaturase [Pyxidicoccus xibeiensis]MCP3143972.1 fatty acid desaturase [Pyxidicoccus xibeiensis]